MMFLDIFKMCGDYSDRKVARYEDWSAGIFVDTCLVHDGRHPYETAVCHPEYRKDKLIIVEAYETKEAAQRGHDKWVTTITSRSLLPPFLVDCCNAKIGVLEMMMGAQILFPHLYHRMLPPMKTKTPMEDNPT